LSRGYLLDTTIISILYPGRPEHSPELIEWLRKVEDRTFVSSVSFFELAQGVAKLQRSGARARASALIDWIDGLAEDFGARILLLDVATARIAGTLSDQATARGRHPGVADIMIAATAKMHDLVLLTRNMKHFEPLGIAAIDPVASLPE
jgi:toxin FitB